MQAQEAFRYVLDNSGKSQRQISRDLGKVDTFISSMLSGKRTPGLQLMANVADVCGYDLLLVNRQTGEAIPIDPNCQDESKTD